jgi:hypothetical protein
MSKSSQSYTRKPIAEDRPAFERLLVLIATLVHHPGIGCADLDSKTTHHNALIPVQTKMREIAEELNLSWRDCYPATPTIRKDLETLRDYGILDRRMYRWGYYLGTGVMNLADLSCALDALTSQAKYQGDVLARQAIERLTKRLKGLNLENKGHLFYPIRQQINTSIVYTDPSEMMEQGRYRYTLFDRLEQIEIGILGGKTIEINKIRDPFGTNLGKCQVIPLQLIYSDIAWYLICEDAQNGHLFVSRLDRYSDYYQEIDTQCRDLTIQKQRLEQAHLLLTNGWGLYLGSPVEQEQELANLLPLTKIVVRFWYPVAAFIKEGEKRHRSQKIKDGKKDSHGLPTHIDYEVILPPRSLNEFMFWVNRFMDAAQIILPSELADLHLQKARGIVDRYHN